MIRYFLVFCRFYIIYIHFVLSILFLCITRTYKTYLHSRNVHTLRVHTKVKTKVFNIISNLLRKKGGYVFNFHTCHTFVLIDSSYITLNRLDKKEDIVILSYFFFVYVPGLLIDKTCTD